MGKPALVIVTAMLLLRLGMPAPAQNINGSASGGASSASNALNSFARNRVAGYTAWDDDYLYVAVLVNKPVLKAKNSAPFSNPLEDDAVIISVQTDDDHKATQRTAHTFTVAVSAANGSQLYSGPDSVPLFVGLADFNAQLEEINKQDKDPAAQQARRIALFGKVLKSAAVVRTSSNSTGPSGYTVEVAIPWSDMGGKPEAGARMGFNVAAQSVDPTAGSPALQSLASAVKGAADLSNPSLWGTIQFSNSPGNSTREALISPRVFTNRPVVDGDLTNGEWNGLSAFEFGEVAVSTSASGALTHTLAARSRPDFTPQPARPLRTMPVITTEPLAVSAHHPQKVAPLVIARYDYRYQADTRKAAPTERVTHTDGGTALVLHPLDGVGPWFSYDRADWHRRQLQDARRAGIDVILPIYSGSARDRQLYADKGLLVLATALNALKQAGQDYPQVALYLDTHALSEVFGDRPDLRETRVQAALYSIIRNFYWRIPAAFRCQVPLDATNGGHLAYPVFLSNADAFKAFDSSFVAYVRGRFAADFPGADLLLLGEGGFKAHADLDGYFTESTEKGFQLNKDGWISVGAVRAGQEVKFLDTAQETKAAVLTRKSGDTYRTDWAEALGQHPDWILLPGWNDFVNGGAIAPTLEMGYSTADLTKIYTRLFAGTAPIGLKILGHNAPGVMVAHEEATVSVRVQNIGTQGWGPANTGQVPVTFAYRWLQNGEIVASSRPKTLVSLLAGQDSDVPVKVSATRADGSPLNEGDYTLEIGALSTDKRAGTEGWIGGGANGSMLSLPVHVRSAAGADAPALAATLVQTDLPTMLESGSVYDVHAVFRNDGATTWQKTEGTRITARIFRLSTEIDPTTASETLTETPVPTADATVELPQDVPPGQLADVRLQLPLMNAEGKALPAWNQEQLWTYAIRWEIAREGAQGATVRAASAPDTTAANSVFLSPIPIAVVDFDFGVRFTADGTLPSLPGDKRLPMRLSLQNMGPQVWKKDEVRIGYHWYYQDGTELIWEDETTPLNQDVPPGGRVTDFLAWLTPPPFDGTYWLVWDVKVGDTWASTAASTRAYDETIQPIQVFGGRLTCADLSKAYTLDGVTEDKRLTDGNFDGKGNTFPADLVPPFANSDITPVGMWLPGMKGGPDSPRRISFRWGPKGPAEKNFIVCQGQRVELGKSSGQCRQLHILAASTEKDVLTTLKLIFQEPTSQSEDLYSFQVSPWDQPPTHGEDIAYLSFGHHSKDGLQAGAVALYHYVITIKEPRKLVALILPNEPSIKIGALSLEK